VAEAERRPRRRYYALTPKGVEALEEAADRLARATRGIRRAAAGSSGR
jgi:DNA-binding PadR family transcriptional regulator